jgi:electron transfer flavoprotein alpha/beta subunit
MGTRTLDNTTSLSKLYTIEIKIPEFLSVTRCTNQPRMIEREISLYVGRHWLKQVIAQDKTHWDLIGRQFSSN